MSDSEQDEIVTEFLVEAHENLDVLDRELLALEKNPHTPELLASVFRRVHTVKGACGFLGFAKMETVAHASESLLSKVREEELELTPTIITALLGVADTMRGILRGIEANGKEADEDYSSVVENINRLQRGGEPPATPAPVAAPTPARPAPAPALAPAPACRFRRAPRARAAGARCRTRARRTRARHRSPPPHVRPHPRPKRATPKRPQPPSWRAAASAPTTSPTRTCASTSACSTS